MLRFGIFCLCLASVLALPPPKKIPYGKLGPRIINGQNATLGQFPWQAALHVTSDSYSWFCGGSLISEEWILTAGHCVDEAKSARIVTGSLEYTGDTGTVSSGQDFILHESYDALTLENDIGLIRLAEALTFDDNTKAVGLSNDTLEVNTTITISGWGLTSDDAAVLSPDLEYVDLVAISNSACEEYYGKGLIVEGMVCAVSPTSEVKSSCSGDSGGGAVTNSTTNPLHVGIVSFVSSRGCESGAPSGFTRTANYRAWILEKTGI
ncbi:brachyurin [Tribolium castaneum]|uniref:Yippee interacting protein 7 n=1 Tax=Tribolium castaneum TaxID=7070 RepID=D6WPA6_TRICA|nr:PREDICTED: brachyurin [Tribolium castaneum]EFA07583.1 yippee interacting protein 7 [Tribolium castaneum]|eukprot:XP_967551.1 PREDICTED: brachyurin [Tribolium castaneum]